MSFSTLRVRKMTEIDSPGGKAYSLQRTQLYTNGNIGFLPLWTKSFSEPSAEPNTYDTATWELFEALECSGVRQFVLDTSLGRESGVLYGGRDDVAEGASYRICTRLMEVKEQTNLVAIKVIKGSLLRSRSESHGDAAASR